MMDHLADWILMLTLLATLTTIVWLIWGLD